MVLIVMSYLSSNLFEDLTNFKERIDFLFHRKSSNS